jgi:lysine 2,3-aminomutase
LSTAALAVRHPQSWEKLLAGNLSVPEDLVPFFEIEPGEIRAVLSRYPMRINPYYMGLIQGPGDGLFEQAVPDPREIHGEDGFEDPLMEEDLSPVPGLTHKYPDRVLFLVSSRCAMYCRFCNRKRKVGRPSMVTKETIREGLSYIRNNRKVRDVLLSGGDPLLLPDDQLFNLLTEVRSFSHVEIIRIGTRTPCTLPHRITPELVKLLRGFHPLYISTHFNHPAEVTPEAALACTRLADAGIPIGCQSVLLKGVNDDSEILETLMRRLVRIRVKPYYLFQADLVRGTSHFWTPVEKGTQIMSNLQKNLPGFAVPRYVIDLPGGGGKVEIGECSGLPVSGSEF